MSQSECGVSVYCTHTAYFVIINCFHIIISIVVLQVLLRDHTGSTGSATTPLGDGGIPAATAVTYTTYAVHRSPSA